MYWALTMLFKMLYKQIKDIGSMVGNIHFYLEIKNSIYGYQKPSFLKVLTIRYQSNNVYHVFQHSSSRALQNLSFNTVFEIIFPKSLSYQVAVQQCISYHSTMEMEEMVFFIYKIKKETQTSPNLKKKKKKHI